MLRFQISNQIKNVQILALPSQSDMLIQKSHFKILRLPTSFTFFFFLHLFHKYGFPLSLSLLLSPKQTIKQNTAMKLKAAYLLYVREIQKHSRCITGRPGFKSQLCHQIIRQFWISLSMYPCLQSQNRMLNQINSKVFLKVHGKLL